MTDESRLALAMRKIAELEKEIASKDAALTRAAELMRGFEDERNDLARQLGVEVARTQELKGFVVECDNIACGTIEGDTWDEAASALLSFVIRSSHDLLAKVKEGK